ncbi:hypothetical protein [Nocardioides zeae]|uniref:YfhO family protein n=1 Tax=Nocardioides zeae TaxID=1457234 RepID=A0A6P0HL36_9ACTN|nr:hypothetical protein [Nocardioides zeae]NEN79392.1 hypothetical protein [Nocardioides zeae]
MTVDPGPASSPGAVATPAVPRRTALLLDALAVLVAVVLLGPALLPGLVLSYDMVWLPDLPVTQAGWGLVDGAPRAVPSDQVVALLDELVGGVVLQKAVLLGSLVAVGSGAHRVVRTAPAGVRAAAVVLATWNPYVVERLLLGHWTMLLAYAVLPWLHVAGRRAARGRPLPAGWLLLLPIGSLSGSAGVATALAAVLLVGVVGRAGPRRWALLVAALAAANAPWVVAGLAAPGSEPPTAAAARTAAEVFAARGPDGVPAPVAVLGLGGIWNTDVVPASLAGPWAWAWAAAVVGLLVVASRAVAGGPPVRERVAVLGLAAAGLGLGLLTWCWPAASAAVALAVPGGGLLRDGSRLAGLALPALLVGAATAAARATGATRATRAARARGARGDRRGVVLAPALVWVLPLLPVAALPDAALGVQQRLEAVAVPDDLARAADALADDDVPGAVVVLPFATYRAPAWNGGRPVLDPTPRALGASGREVVAADDLYVDGRRLPGEDVRARAVLAALALPDADARTDALLRLGVSHVVVDRGPDVADAPTELVPGLRAKPLLTTDGWDVRRLEGRAAPPLASTGRVVVLAGAWGAFAVLVAAGGLGALRGAVVSALRRNRRAHR